MSDRQEIRYFAGNAAVRAVANAPSILTGRAVVYGQTSQLLYGSFREQIMPGAFRDWLAKGPDVMALIDHQDGLILGRISAGTLRISDGPDGLDAEVDAPNTSYARDLVESIGRGDIRGMSFRFTTLDDDWSQLDGIPLRKVVRARVYEVSFVANPAYPQTEAMVRSVASVYEGWTAQRAAEQHRRRLRLVLSEKG